MVFIKQLDGHTICYESRASILSDASLTIANESFGPDDFDTVTDQQSTPTFPTEIPPIARQFFGIGDDAEPTPIDEINRHLFDSPFKGLVDDVTATSTSSLNSHPQDLYPTSLGYSTSGPLISCNQENYVDNNSIGAAFSVRREYAFPSNLLFTHLRRENTYGFFSLSPSAFPSLPLPAPSPLLSFYQPKQIA